MAPSSQETNIDKSSGDHPVEDHAAATMDTYADNRSNDDDVATTEETDRGTKSSSVGSESSFSSRTPTVTKCVLAVFLLYCAFVGGRGLQQQQQNQQKINTTTGMTTTTQEGMVDDHRRRRRLTMVGDDVPKYMEPLMKDLRDRQQLFDETPPEEVKYWFEYTGPLQKYFYRFSKSRAKADYFEGRDDSGVTSIRFTEPLLGGSEHATFFTPSDDDNEAKFRVLENCIAMGSPTRPDTRSQLWKEWYGDGSNSNSKYGGDRCRILFTLNTVGAGRGTTMLWETAPPQVHAQGPNHWTSEQETAATHIQRNLEEINAMCATGQVAARVQVLVCEPISARWTEWMDSLLPHCGGQPSELEKIAEKTTKVEERASPVQVVVVATTNSADTCHDLKSGFMERRVQDLILAPPFLGEGGNGDADVKDPSIKLTHPDLISTDDHDLYVGLKWTSMVTMRSVQSFLQASADLAAGATSPANQGPPKTEVNADGVSVAISNAPSSPFLVPSFVRVSYVSEENAKVAKWRMHGDFFHPAAWEICKDSFEVTWIDHSLSGPGGVKGLCYDDSSKTEMQRRLKAADSTDCGQWWVYMNELQMPTSPDVYANEVSPAVVQGGSNFFWMVTERQRREIVKREVCVHKAGGEKDADCPLPPQAVMPLGDLESFLINFTPNTALGKKHIKGRRPGYSREKEREEEREKVRERKQLKGQEDIEKALFDYTIYPAALFRKDATLKAARARDMIMTSSEKRKNSMDGSPAIGPQTIKSEYYDVTITKPRPPVLGWCQAVARKGLCALYSDYFRTSNDTRCLEACGMKKNWSPIQ
eukprot:CAMPEP_0113484026 /NCGR_PEP_ID=MMETSP0014_2-20120614/23743_1 /TAXON_ID=2857 /ORGANISM="Nitzschia sp." /LENGTH=815 /DNA_ID=CAMNT_0000377603 /DNA_START=341 /DNA_END=2788 /DNA_ORIENTATION=- /assembly_acc=CAM_ASM_000159